MVLDIIIFLVQFTNVFFVRKVAAIYVKNVT